MIEVRKWEGGVKRTIEIPGSKSHTNRVLLLAALTPGPISLHNPLFCDDTQAMITCLKTLGIGMDINPQQITVHEDISAVKEKEYRLFACDSGTTLRFLLPLLCLVPGEKVIEGTARLNARPIADLVDALRQLGACIDYLGKEGGAPLRVRSSPLTAKKISLKGEMSSQFCSALLMIAPLMGEMVLSHEGPLVSRSYLEMTLSIMKEWQVTVEQMRQNEYRIAHQRYQKRQTVIEGDFSSAGYFFAIAALTGSTLTLKNLNPHSSQPDRKFLSVLEKMGNTIHTHDQGISIQGGHIVPLEVTMEECPDQVQTLAVLAAFAKGVTKISGVRSLRVKETERVVALKNELLKMGIRTEDTHDTLTIYGGNPRPATIETYGDHRMAMAFAVAGTRLSGMKIKNPEVVTKTFPHFWNYL